MQLDEAIKVIVNQFGKEIIAERRFIYMIADYYSFRDNPAEKRVLTAIVNDGYSARIWDIENGCDFSVTINQIINNVCRNYGFREDLVKEVISYIVNGIGYKYQCNKLKQSTETLTEVENNTDGGITSDIVFYLKRTTNKSQIICDAKGHYNFVDGSFVIHKGSLLCMRTLKLEKYIGTNGDKYVKRKFILDKKCSLQRKGLYLVETNITCSSPSDAAFIVTCKETNGLNAWKDKKGLSLKQCINELPSFSSKEVNGVQYSENFILGLYPILFKDNYHKHRNAHQFKTLLQLKDEDVWDLLNFFQRIGACVYNPHSYTYDILVDSKDKLQKLYQDYQASLTVYHKDGYKFSTIENAIRGLCRRGFTSVELLSQDSGIGEENAKEYYSKLLDLEIIDPEGNNLYRHAKPSDIIKLITKINN